MCRIFAGQDPRRYAPETRRLRLNGQSTSLRLEAAFWEILDAIAAGQGMSTPAFISKVHDEVLVEVPEDELDGMGPNVLALAPRVALALERNVETRRRRLERAGVEVLTYEGAELSKGDGGPTCLTRPLVRD